MATHRKFRVSLCLLGLAVLSVACNASPAPSTTAPALATGSSVMNSPLTSPLDAGVTTVVAPAAGKSTVTGIILSAANSVPLGNVSVYLAPVYRQDGNAAYILDTATSPSTLTSVTGQFIAKDIAPGEYVVVIGDPSASYAILNEPNDQAKVWKVDADAVLDIGMHNVTLR